MTMYKDEICAEIRKYISENVKPGEYLDFEEMNTEIAEKLYDSAITAERDPETAKEAYIKDPRAGLGVDNCRLPCRIEVKYLKDHRAKFREETNHGKVLLLAGH